MIELNYKIFYKTPISNCIEYLTDYLINFKKQEFHENSDETNLKRKHFFKNQLKEIFLILDSMEKHKIQFTFYERIKSMQKRSSAF